MVEKSHTAGDMRGNWYPRLLQPFHDMGHRIADFFAPDAAAAATGEQYEIDIELPGVDLENIHIDVHDGGMTVRGEKKAEREETGKTYFFSERTYGAFERSFRLPANANADKITANFKDGVLSIVIPKSGPPPDKTRRIEINRGE